MDDADPKPSIEAGLNEATVAWLRRTAEKARRIAEYDTLDGRQPGPGEKAKAVLARGERHHGRGHAPADDLSEAPG
jgi:hypothetical protein